MRKINKILLSILGGCNAVIDLFTPVAIAILWTYHAGFDSFGSYLILIIGSLASLFRGIKEIYLK